MMEAEVSVFGGQGIMSGQLAELRRVVALPPVRSFVEDLSVRLSSEVNIIVSCRGVGSTAGRQLAEGLDIGRWAKEGKAGGPSQEYLSGAPVSLVLTLVIQLATFRYCWACGVAGAGSPATVPSAGAVGHSQGMAAAIVVALATDADSFLESAWTFARLLLYFGVCVADQTSAAVAAAHQQHASVAGGGSGGGQAGERDAAGDATLLATSCALAVLKVPVADVATLVAEFSNATAGEASIAHCVVKNGASACVVMGLPRTVASFQHWLVERQAQALPSPQPDQAAKTPATRLLPIRAPFHCESILAPALDQCRQLLFEAGGSAAEAQPQPAQQMSAIPSSALRRPMWSCVDGRCLTPPTAAEADRLSGGVAQAPRNTIIPNLQLYVLRALATQPVEWPTTLQAIADGRSGGSSGDDGAYPPLQLVDYGPGGGSGACYLSNTVRQERGEVLCSRLAAVQYFSQRHCCAGQLPQSWLKWVRSDEAAKSEDEATS